MSRSRSLAGGKDVNARIVEILGLDADAFLRTVVLPQGHFARLLVDDDQKVRTGVLRQIWRTDELEAAGALAADAVTELLPLRGRVHQAMDSEPTDAATHLAGLRAAAMSAEAEAVIARQRHHAVMAAVADRDRAVGVAETSGKIASRLGVWDADAARNAADEVAAAARAADATSTALAAEELAGRARLDAVPADTDGLDLVALLAADAALAAIPALVEAEAAASTAVIEAEAEASAAETAEVTAAAAHAEAEARFEKAAVERHALVEAADELAAAVSVAGRALDDARRARLAADEADQRRNAADIAAAGATTEADAAALAVLEAQRVDDEAAAALDVGRRSAAAVVAAHGLHTGDLCPVCDRDLPESWSPPRSDDLDRLEAARSATAAALQAAREAATRADAHCRSADRLAAESRTAAQAAEEAAVATFSTLVGMLGSEPSLQDDDERVLAAVLAELSARTAALAAHDDAAATIQRALTAASAALGTAAAELASAARRVTEAAERRAGAARALADRLATVPDDLRPATGDEVAAAIEASRTLLAERRAVLEARAAEREALRSTVDGLVASKAAAERARHASVDEPVEELWAAVSEHISFVRLACDRLDIEPPDLPVRRPAVADLVVAVEHTAKATVEVLAVNDAALADARASVERAVEVLASAAGDLGSAPDAPDLVDRAREADERSALEHRRALEDAERFAARAEAINALVAAGARLESTFLAINDLAVALKDGAFPKWLTLRRSKRLLIHASRLLEEMTAGRYGFADLDDDASPWAIFDHEAGQPRSPASLSGGEKFVASLALSLGMVEMVGRAGGTLESLFLDEGFGALDRTNLDAAVEALASVAASGRMVAVISHVRSVAEQVEHVLSVTREPTGTKVVWLDDAGRTELAEGELGAAAALAGLLD